MTRQRTTHALLAVVVALLGLHLALRLSPPKATAQEPQVWPPPVEIIQITGAGYVYGTRHVDRIYRLWSDGTIEVNVRVGVEGWRGWQDVPE